MRITIAHAVAMAIAASTTGLAAAADSATDNTARASEQVPDKTSAPHSFSIPAGDLADALKTFAKQTASDLVYRPEQVAGLKTAGVSGELMRTEAIARLLRGTNLRASTDASTGAILIATPLPIATKPAAQGSANLGTTRWRLAQADADGTTNTSPAAERSASSSDIGALEEIIVTAQKRAESLKDVPISIVALSGNQLDRSTAEGIADSLDAVAGVFTLEGRSVGTQVIIRGVGQSGPLLGGANPVAYYLDSVPFGFARHAVTPDAGVYDLERVEVLRGPQGTLYGANALSGVVRILTHEPEFNTFAFKTRAGLSSTSYSDALNYRSDAALNLPLVDDKVAMRVVAGYQKFAGWIDKPNDKDANDSRLTNFRVKLKAQPTERLTANLSVAVSRQDYGAYSIGLADHTYPSTPFADPRARAVSPFPEPQATDYDIYAGTISYDFDFADLTSSTSYMEFRAETPLDYGPLGLPWIGPTELEANVVSHESVLNSSGEGPWRWSAGFFYRDAKDRTIQPLLDYTTGTPLQFSPTPFRLDWRDFSKSHAIFGEVTRELAPGLELTAGLRYFQDKVRIEDLTGATPNDSETFEAWSPRAVLTWKPNDGLMAYASFSKGFRSGMIQVPATAALGVPPAKPDKLFNYELGTKLSMLGGMLDVDTAVYYIDWKDIIISGVPVTGSSNVQTAATTNAAGANGVGFEAALNVRPVHGLTLGVSVGWNDLKFSDTATFTLANGSTRILAVEDDRLFRSPEVTASGSAAYEFDLGAGNLIGNVSASAQHVSKFHIANLAGTKSYSEPQFIGRVSLGVRSPDRWEGSLYVDNVANEQGISAPETNLAPQWVGRARPRTVGMQFSLQF